MTSWRYWNVLSTLCVYSATRATTSELSPDIAVYLTAARVTSQRGQSHGKNRYQDSEVGVTIKLLFQKSTLADCWLRIIYILK